jgi:Dyp-type peroxidase family
MAIDFSDVQGIIVRGNSFPRTWHLFYKFPGRSQGKEFLRWIQPLIATAAPFPNEKKPESMTFLGLTYRGLRALGLEAILRRIKPELTLGDVEMADDLNNPFPSEFVLGPEPQSLGDTHPDDVPTTWWNNRFPTSDIHGSLHIYCETDPAAEQTLREVRAKFHDLGVQELNPNGATTEPLAGHLLTKDGQLLMKGRQVHFGYMDGIAQPDVDWENDAVDPHKVDRGHFLLGYDSPISSSPSFSDTEDFFRNSAYLAFRWMSQDVPTFERFLTDSVPLVREAYPMAQNPRELLAAKLIGRWRNGIPILEAPVDESSTLEPGDSFRYDVDPSGLRCPFSAHVRVSNPRDQKVNGLDEVPRLIRRGMPYGNPWQNGVNDQEDRGLFGMFLCASLRRQFQLIMRWINSNDFSPVFGSGMPVGQDPLFGARGLSNKRPPFRIQISTTKTIEIPLPERAFVRSRGTAYLLLPGVKTISRIVEE